MTTEHTPLVAQFGIAMRHKVPHYPHRVGQRNKEVIVYLFVVGASVA
jgi:hypothetical protein